MEHLKNISTPFFKFRPFTIRVHIILCIVRVQLISKHIPTSTYKSHIISPINCIFLVAAYSAYNIQNCRKQGVCDLGVLVLGDIFILAYRRNFVVPASHSCENAGGQSTVQHIVKAVGIIQKTVGFLEIFFKSVIADSIAKLLCFLYRIFQIVYTLFDIGTA